MPHSNSPNSITSLTGGNQPIALRLVPIMCVWWKSELSNVIDGKKITSVFGNSNEKLIKLPVYHINKNKTFSELPSLSHRNHIDDPLLTDKVKALSVIPPEWFVKKNDLEKVFKQTLDNKTYFPDHNDANNQIDWNPSLGKFNKAIEECPQELLGIIQPNQAQQAKNTSKTDKRNIDLTERAAILYHAHKGRTLKKLSVDLFNQLKKDNNIGSFNTPSSIERVLNMKDIKKRVEKKYPQKKGPL